MGSHHDWNVSDMKNSEGYKECKGSCKSPRWKRKLMDKSIVLFWIFQVTCWKKLLENTVIFEIRDWLQIRQTCWASTKIFIISTRNNIPFYDGFDHRLFCSLYSLCFLIFYFLEFIALEIEPWDVIFNYSQCFRN